MNDRFLRIVRVLEPVLLHFLAANMINILNDLLRLHADAASLTTITAVLTLPLFLFMLKKDMLWRRSRGMDMTKRFRIWMIPVCLAGAYVCNMVMTWMLNAVFAELHKLFGINLSNQIQDGLFGSAFWIQLIGIGVIVPIVEEVMMRGLVYNRLKDYNKKWSAIFWSALIFAVYHGNAIQFMFSFPMGVLIAWLYSRCGTLVIPVLFHVAVNFSSVITVFLGNAAGH